MIKRVEVLKDGASTTCGSDAISGVVNFILDDEFEGLKVSAGMGEGLENGQAANEDFGIMAGLNADRGNVVFAVGDTVLGQAYIFLGCRKQCPEL